MIREIMRKIDSNTRLAELFRFAVAGCIGFIIDYGVMVLLKAALGGHYLLAAGVSFAVSVVVNYLICVSWVFKGIDRPGAKSTAVFITTSVIGLGLNELFMWLFVDVFFIHYMIAKIIATLLVMIWNYITKRRALVK